VTLPAGHACHLVDGCPFGQSQHRNHHVLLGGGLRHVFSIAEFDVMNNGMAPGQAIDKAFKRAEAIFAKYQIVQG
jgi:hypothetical protein